MKIQFLISKKQKDRTVGFIIGHNKFNLFRSGVVVLIGGGNFANVIAKSFKDTSGVDYVTHYSKTFEFITPKEYRLVFRLLTNIKHIETR